MPNTTKLDRELAAASGGAVTANQVHRWRDEGRLSALPLSRADQVEHLLALAPLMGKGRDGDVAVLKMAADGHPCECLRRVLAELQEVPPSQRGLASDVDRMTEEAGEGDLLGPWYGMFNAEDAPSVWKLVDGLTTESSKYGVERSVMSNDVRRSLVLPAAQVIAGERVEPGDMLDAMAIADKSFARHMRGGTESTDDPSTTDVLPEETEPTWAKACLELIGATVKAGRGAHAWIETASPTDLARGVRIGAELAEAMSEVFWTVGDEERWRIAGRIAPMSAIMLPLLATLGVSFSNIPKLPMTAREVAIFTPLCSAFANIVELAGALGPSPAKPR